MKTADIQLDTNRHERLGIEEAIFCEGKAIVHLNELLTDASNEKRNLLMTRLHEEQYLSIKKSYRDQIDYDPVSSTGIFGNSTTLDRQTLISVISAGTSDIRVSREAVRTLEYHGRSVNEISDVGVAGLWRLTTRLDDIRKTPVAIVVAGMDAALPSVLGGLFDGIIIAVPTSVGYGVSRGGTTALNAVLASCAPGITVMNIDNGYGAACAALRAINMLEANAPIQSDVSS